MCTACIHIAPLTRTVVRLLSNKVRERQRGELALKQLSASTTFCDPQSFSVPWMVICVKSLVSQRVVLWSRHL
jgi:hypothetical protein